MASPSSPQYKAIKSFYSDLVEAVSTEIDILIQKAWSKDLIGKRQLDISLLPSSTDDQKATKFVSVITTRVSVDSKAFDQFVSLLREVHSLEYLASCLEDKVKKIFEQGLDNSIMPASAGASVSPYSSRSPANGHDQRTSIETPKLDPYEDTQTVESGIVEDDQDLGPPVGEQQVTCLGEVSGNSGFVHIPQSDSETYIQSFQKAGGEDGSASHSGGLVETQEQNLVSSFKDDEQDVSPSEEMDSSLSNPLQEMVMTSSKQKLLSSTSAKASDTINEALSVIHRENVVLKARIRDLEERLAASRQSEAELNKQVITLTEEKQILEYELHIKKEEKEKLQKDHEKEVEALELKLKETEDKVRELKEMLSNVEKESKQQKEECLKKIQKLKEQRAELHSRIDKMSDDYKKKELENQANIIKLLEEIQKSDKELCDYKVNLAKSETEIANQKTDIANLKAELNAKQIEIERQNNELLKRAHKEEMDKNEAFHQSNSVSKEMYEAKVKEFDELNSKVKDLHVALTERQDSNTESVGRSSSSGLNPETHPQVNSIERQTSHSESGGRQSSSSSNFSNSIKSQTSHTESVENDSDVHFNVSDDNEETSQHGFNDEQNSDTDLHVTDI